jgi:Domain of unknown function (DUF4160)
MAKVQAFEVDGVQMWIPSGDHNPPHLHARKPGHWVVKVKILEPGNSMIEVLRPPDARIDRSDRKAIVQGVEAHRDALLREFEACQGSD